MVLRVRRGSIRSGTLPNKIGARDILAWLDANPNWKASQAGQWPRDTSKLRSPGLSGALATSRSTASQISSLAEPKHAEEIPSEEQAAVMLASSKRAVPRLCHGSDRIRMPSRRTPNAHRRSGQSGAGHVERQEQNARQNGAASYRVVYLTDSLLDLRPDD